MTKRRRTDTGYVSVAAPSHERGNRRARAISAKINKRWPLASYGRVYVKRGEAENLARFGPSWREASAEQRAARKAAGYYGKGDYKSFLKYASRGLGGLAGGALGYMRGGLAGAAAGAQGGWDSGAKVSKFFGWGDYGGDAGGNQIMGPIASSVPMRVNSGADLSGDVYLSHREFVGNVQAIGAGANSLSPFNVTSFAINAGISKTFPWLSQLAQNFTMYEFQGLIFEYRPTSGEMGSTSNQLGKIVLATQYDPDALPFTNSVVMENYDYANACKPSQQMAHGVETHPNQTSVKMLYTRWGDSPKDKVLTDIGTFQVATEGLPNSVTSGVPFPVGELWVTYKVKLSRANLTTAIGANLGADYHVGIADGTTLSTATSSTLATLGWTNYFTVPTNTTGCFARRTNSTIGCILSAVGSALRTQVNITFPNTISSGYFKIVAIFDPQGATTNAFNAITAVTNCTQVQVTGIQDYNTYTNCASNLAAKNDLMFQVFHIMINAPGNLQAGVNLVYNANVLSGGRTFVEIHQIPPILS